MRGSRSEHDTAWTDEPLCPFCGKVIGYGPDMSDGIQECGYCGRYCQMESEAIIKFTTTKPETIAYQGIDFIRLDGPWWLCVECSNQTRMPADHAAEPHESRAAR